PPCLLLSTTPPPPSTRTLSLHDALPIYSKHGGMPGSALLGVAMQSFSGGVALLLAGLLSGEFHRFHFAGVSRASWVALAYLIVRSEEHTSELQSRGHLVCRLLLEKKKV